MCRWIACLALVLAASHGYGGDWAAWRGPNANGISDETGWSPASARLLWKRELGVGYSSVAVKDGRLFTMGHAEGTDTVYGLDARTGEPVWSHSYPCETGQYKGPRATPVADGDALYTVSRAGDVFRFDAATGKVAWQTDVLKATGNDNIRWGISSSVVVEGDLLLLNIGESGVALDKRTGKTEWKSKGRHSYATPVVFDHGGRRLAAVFSAPGLQIVDAQSGKRIDGFKWETKYDINGADPLVAADGRIFISSGYNRGCAMLGFSTGKLRKLWESDLLKNQFSSSVWIGGHIYGIDGQTRRKGFLRCIAAADGSEQWSMQVGFGSLIAVDNKLVVLDEGGVLRFAEVDPSAYREIHRFDTGLGTLCWTPPVLANGIVYCRNDKGALVAIDVRN